MPDFWQNSFAVHLRVIYKKHCFLRYHHLLWTLSLSTHIFKTFLLGTFFSPSPYLHFGSGLRSVSPFYAELRFLKNIPLLVCSSGANHTEKQDLLFLKTALTRRRKELEGREWYRSKGFFMLYKLSITSFLSLYKWKFQNTHPHLVVKEGVQNWTPFRV